MGLVDGFAQGIALGDRVHRTQLLEKQQDRVADQQELENRYREEDRDFQNWTRSEVKRNNLDEKTKNRLAAISFSAKEGKDLSPDDVSFLMKHAEATDPETYKLLTDDKYRAESAQVNDVLAQRFSGKYIPKSDLLAAVNFQYSDQIGEGKELTDFNPSPDGEGLVFSVRGENIDGEKPVTKFRMTEQDGDNEVKVIPFSDIASDIARRNMLIRSIDKWRIAMGDNTPITSANDAATQAETYRREDETADRDQGYAVSLAGINHGYKMSEIAAKPGKDGKDGKDGKGGGLKANEYTQFHDALLKSMISRYPIKVDEIFTDDGFGNKKIDINRYFNALPEEGKAEWLKAESLGEGLMSNGSTPVQAAMQALSGDTQSDHPMMASHGQGQAKVLDRQTAQQFLKAAGGDKTLARQLAAKEGYTF